MGTIIDRKALRPKSWGVSPVSEISFEEGDTLIAGKAGFDAFYNTKLVRGGKHAHRNNKSTHTAPLILAMPRGIFADVSSPDFRRHL